MTLKLLLVGKEKSAFQLIKSAFENEDVDIIVATSIGLALFLARKNQPNLIISQEELADSDAVNFFHELKSEEELAEIPFVLLTSEKDRTNKVKDKLSAKNISDSNIGYLSLSKKADLSSTNNLKDKILAFIPKLIN
jgi:response regulator RpfG family c-di-GMP phosphodiesterase